MKHLVKTAIVLSLVIGFGPSVLRVSGLDCAHNCEAAPCAWDCSPATCPGPVETKAEEKKDEDENPAGAVDEKTEKD